MDSLNCPWLLFNPDIDAKILYVEILMQKFIEGQPKNLREVDALCEELYYPLIDNIQALCLAHGLRQVCSTNLEGVQIHHAKPHIFLKLAWNIYNHTKDCILLDGFNVSNTRSPMVVALIQAVRNILPPFMRNLITLTPGQQQSDEGNDEYDECFESLEEETDEIVQVKSSV